MTNPFQQLTVLVSASGTVSLPVLTYGYPLEAARKVIRQIDQDAGKADAFQVQAYDTCVLWSGTYTMHTYPVVWVMDRGMAVNKLLWVLTYRQKFPDAQVVYQTCGMKQCVNPLHQLAVSRSWIMAPAASMSEAEDQASKLDVHTVTAIRNWYALGGATQAELATTFDVSRSAVSRIVNRRIWKHI